MFKNFLRKCRTVELAGLSARYALLYDLVYNSQYKLGGGYISELLDLEQSIAELTAKLSQE